MKSSRNSDRMIRKNDERKIPNHGLDVQVGCTLGHVSLRVRNDGGSQVVCLRSHKFKVKFPGETDNIGLKGRCDGQRNRKNDLSRISVKAKVVITAMIRA